MRVALGQAGLQAGLQITGRAVALEADIGGGQGLHVTEHRLAVDADDLALFQGFGLFTLGGANVEIGQLANLPEIGVPRSALRVLRLTRRISQPVS